ncbi:MAG: FtsW/RodA/SpoVE family cell cycle protein [Planctomycetota bacterium]|jgi:cell division protein FtsW
MATEATNVKPENDTVEADRRMMDRVLCWLPGSVISLLAVGLVLIYSASAIRAERLGVWSMYFVEKQLIWLVIGGTAMVLASLMDYRLLLRFRWPLFLIGIGGLGGVLVAGAVVNGARRWFRFAGYSLQPSELAKLVLVVALAGILTRMGEGRIRSVVGLLMAIVLCFVPAALIGIEPDLGTAALVGTVLAAMVFVAGAQKRHLIIISLLTLPLAAYYMASRFNHIMGRITAFLEGGREGKAYHAYMSVQSIRSGGLWGTGPGTGWAKLFYLPEAHTDFIFSVLGQEWGLAGTIGVTLAFALIVVCGFTLFRRCPNPFGGLLAFGLTLMLGLQALFNIAVVTATVPTKGISLPFVSFGGSGLVCSLVMVGILISIARVTRRELGMSSTLQACDHDPDERTFAFRPGILAFGSQS